MAFSRLCFGHVDPQSYTVENILPFSVYTSRLKNRPSPTGLNFSVALKRV